MVDSALARPHTTVVLAMSADGKIADVRRSPARFGSAADKAHLEKQVAQADAVLFGAGTLRAYGTTLRVSHPELLEMRSQQGKPAQPVQIVCSRSGEFDPNLRFFAQPVPRWLLTITLGAKAWQERAEFERILVAEAPEAPEQTLDWEQAFQQLATLGIRRLTVLGGGEVVGSLMALDLIDELWLTVCPLILGGAIAPSPVQGLGFSAESAPRLELLSAEANGPEVFLHYRLQR
ncbi:RibD family protein [Trichocoleus sp. FACHB-262]|uniref:RibD family protein n=1 Tax=Trichocoleus sp. FACHB-262 TaxID=2692869 RepID=UPI001688E2F3|nr:RibD family protein [Trichocoleus sp. FACHB-262]MBD2122250.1 RibD family protein [Trichocoleus sp. FACHB-262]